MNEADWRFVREIKVCGDEWDLPEGIPVPLAKTGPRDRFMRRIGNRVEVK